jgi:uncharacterized LabA/DUF88 family protein
VQNLVNLGFYNEFNMSMFKSALFIDNSNFYHSLKESRRLPFPPSDYDKLFGELGKLGYQLREIFLYDGVKDSRIEPQGYAKQQQFHQGIRNLSSKWSITIKTRKLKYRRLNNGPQVFPEEKGVDVLLVIDAVRLAVKKQVDKIILLSGDADLLCYCSTLHRRR